MSFKRYLVILSSVLLLVLVSGAALANDNIYSTVTPVAGPTPIIERNGTASGNIRLTYTFVGTQFPCGAFAQFNLELIDQIGTGNGVYPAELSLMDSGKGTPVQLSPDPNMLSVNGVGWTSSSTVTVNINCDKANDGSLSDGDVIDGQMNIQAQLPSGRNAHVDTISTIQVHIKIVFPSTCLKLYSFESNQDSGIPLNSIAVNAKKNTGEVTSTGPGQISVDALVVNTCMSKVSFDLLIGLDPSWQTNPHNNPGNATFVYNTEGAFDIDSFNLLEFGDGTPQGQLLCLPNVSLDGGYTFLSRVHSAIMSRIYTTQLPTNREFVFGAALYQAGTGCTGDPLGSSIVSSDNPETSTLPFTIN